MGVTPPSQTWERPGFFSGPTGTGCRVIAGSRAGSGLIRNELVAEISDRWRGVTPPVGLIRVGGFALFEKKLAGGYGGNPPSSKVSGGLGFSCTGRDF